MKRTNVREALPTIYALCPTCNHCADALLLPAPAANCAPCGRLQRALLLRAPRASCFSYRLTFPHIRMYTLTKGR